MIEESQISLEYYKAQSFENQAISIALFELQSFSSETLANFLAKVGDTFSERKANQIQQILNSENLKFDYEIQKTILACMPKFVNDRLRFELLQLEILYFIAQSGKKHYPPPQNIEVEQINIIFLNRTWDIQQIPNFQSKWFVEETYQTLEITEMSLAYQYILQNKLANAYEGVCNDLEQLLPKIFHFKKILHRQVRKTEPNTQLELQENYDWIFYTIQLFRISVNIQASIKFNFPKIKLHIKNYPEFKGVFKYELENLIINELSILEKQRETGEANLFVLLKELDLIIEQYQQLKQSGNQTLIKSQHYTQSGYLQIELNIKSYLNKILNNFLLFGGTALIFSIVVILIKYPYGLPISIGLISIFIAAYLIDFFSKQSE